MLQIKGISELLTKNVDKAIYPHIFLMSRNGTLIAYSTPVDTNEAKEIAAMVTLAWNDFDRKDPSSFSIAMTAGAHHFHASASDPYRKPSKTSTKGPRKLNALTIQYPEKKCSVLAREIQANLILVLMGTAPRGTLTEFKTHAEWVGSPRFPPTVPTDRQRQGTPSGAPSPKGTDGSRPSSSASQESTTAQKARAVKPAPLNGGKTWEELSDYEKDIRLGALHVQRKKLDSVAVYVRNEFSVKGFQMPIDASFP
ncbi:hypothetical protein P152DRAFT_402676 [Eremomyces bilateralis CBS 781.70]|uniref:Uncharacterized protein n=1 Tax=Eremomyces bilateralis CBS 781.70 TaxID=1392243 RepID=A0A6G1FVI9_9PEZI|nr:uncharacterized protein P152DRAFT_402676 [Eremomyces bilateralis CBS 781.70]KAF1809728.1 hypothetical protein P152DRAFT_402676 [Eremomyces bilateralis CBS 781.70]